MLSTIFMIFPLVILMILAFFFKDVMKIEIGEGMIISTSAIIVILYAVGSLVRNLFLGMVIIIIFTVFAGIFLIVRMKMKRNTQIDMLLTGEDIVIPRKKWQEIFLSPYIISFFSIAVVLCIIYQGDFIQHIDELHQWAAYPRFMIMNNRVPLHYEYIGKEISVASGIFLYFFQFFTGYNEGLMYAAGNIFYWIGFLLPIGCSEKINWKKALIYVIILYFSLYSLYFYGSKNLYVDIPLAAWAGGFLATFAMDEKKHSKIAIPVSLIMFYMIKNTLGISMIIICLIFMAMKVILIDHYGEGKKRKFFAKKIAYAMTAIIALIIKLISIVVESDGFIDILPQSLQYQILGKGFSGDKVYNTTNTFIKSIFANPLGPNSYRLYITTFVVIVGSILLLYLSNCNKNKNYRLVIYSLFIVIGSMIYLFFLWLGYITTFSYDLSVTCASINRYVSIWCIAIFTFSLFQLVISQNEKTTQFSACEITLLVLIGLFIYGIDGKFIATSTAFLPEDVPYYDEITDVKSQIDKVNDIIGEDSKVYILFQNFTETKSELGVLTAGYYLDGRINNTHQLPFVFTPSGCIIRTSEYPNISIRDFPKILEENDFDYVWVYSADAYLVNNLPVVLGDEEFQYVNDKKEKSSSAPKRYISSDTLHSGQLYKVKRQNGKVTKLILVTNLKTVDIRENNK